MAVSLRKLSFFAAASREENDGRGGLFSSIARLTRQTAAGVRVCVCACEREHREAMMLPNYHDDGGEKKDHGRKGVSSVLSCRRFCA